MSTLWTSEAIATATGGTAQGSFSCNGVAFDSREIGPGDLFFAMTGEQADGHDFVERAFASGASGAVVSRAVDGPHILVPDTFKALEDLGKASRARVDAKIIGVTGSAGKTGTKEALFAALDRFAQGKAHRSVKSYNNHVGVPLSLARMPADTHFGVFEMGMNHEGELAALTRFVRPHVAIVTTIAPAHIAHFRDEAAIADAKGEIFEGLEPGGTAILPFDNGQYSRLRAKAEKHAAHIVSFGFGEGADVRCIDHVAAADGGTLVTAKLRDGLLCYALSQPGAHWVANSLAVLAAVEAVGGDLAQAGLAFAEIEGLKGRGERTTIQLAGGTALLIDESYNANPASMKATIGQLGKTPASRHIVVLGAMKELGVRSDEYHAALLQPLAEAGVSYALLVGEEMAPLVEALSRDVAWAGKFDHCANAKEAADRLPSRLCADDAVLVKGSNSVGLSKLVEALINGGS